MGIRKVKQSPINKVGVNKVKTLEEIQRLEAEKGKQRVELSKKELDKANRKEFIRSFTKPQHFFTAVVCMVLGAGYLYLTTATIIPAIIMGVIAGIMSAYYYSFLPGKLNVVQRDLAQLESYCLDISFHMQTGKTVAQTLKKVSESYNGRVGVDIKHTYEVLRNTGKLDFSHFDKYEFTALDIFHRNMLIAYQDGGDAKRLFKRPLKNMSTELVKRDELYRKNKFQRLQEYVALIIAALIPLTMKVTAGDLYAAFTEVTPAALGIMGICYGGFLLLSFKIQKRTLDISVRA